MENDETDLRTPSDTESFGQWVSSFVRGACGKPVFCGMAGLLSGILITGAVSAFLLAEAREQGRLALQEVNRLNDELRRVEDVSIPYTDDILSVGEPVRAAGSVPSPPPLTPLPSDMDQAGPADAEQWKQRYEKLAIEYRRLRRSSEASNKSDSGQGKLSARVFYQLLRKNTKEEARKLDDRYRQGGLRARDLKELEQQRDEMRHRDWWLKKMANRYLPES